MKVLVLLGALGLAAGTHFMWAEVSHALKFLRLARNEPRRRLRRQIRRQYRAEARVRRELTLDPWLGRGGRLLFDPSWTDIKTRG